MHELRAMSGGSAIFPGIAPELPMHQTPMEKAVTSQPSGAADMSSEQVRQLTTAVKRGDEAAFTRFHELYGLRLYKLALSLTGGREGEAGEVLQSVMIKLTRRFEVFDDEKRLWTWLSSVARHSYIDYYRRQKREERFLSLEAGGAESAEARPAEDRLVAALLVVMEELAPEDRELLRAFYLDKRPLGDLAEEAGQSYKAIESRMTRLRRKVKENLLTHLQNENTPST